MKNLLGSRQMYWQAEALATLLVLVLLFVFAWQLRGDAYMVGTQQRYEIDAAVPVAMPSSVRTEAIAAACGQASGELSEWQTRSCRDVPAAQVENVQAVINQQLATAQSQYATPLVIRADISAEDWALARAGLLPKDANNKADETEWAAMFSKRYDLSKNQTGEWYSPALSCSLKWLQTTPKDWSRLDANLMSAHILAGRVSLVRQGLNKLPAVANSYPDSLIECAELGSPDTLMLQAARTQAQALISVENARKAQTMSSLPSRAGWILLVYGAVALFVLNFSRASRLSLGMFTGGAIILWALAGWLTKVFLPPHLPSWFWFGLMGAGVGIIIAARFLPALQPRVLQQVTSRIGFPVFVLLLGIGWLVLLDLSTHAHTKNRYLALYQQSNLLIAFMLVSILPAWRLEIMSLLARFYAHLLLMVDRWQWLKFAAAVAVVVVIAIVLRNQRQFTSELWRMWLVFGLGYFLCMRSAMIVSNIKEWWRPLSLILMVPIVGFIVTDDNGPLLVTLFGGILLIGGLLAAFLRTEWQWRWYIAMPAGFLFSIGLSTLLIAVLFTLGQVHERTAERLASVFDPFAASNDQMALVHNFRASIPSGGYGFGDVPWCGEQMSQFCAGVPAQIQSDYTLTALQGVFGTSVAIFLLIISMLIWWMRLLFNQQTQVKKSPELGGMTPNNAQTWISWISLSWLVLLLFQLLITVSANLGFFPLTGITFPFVSYGSMSLWANSVLLAFTLNVVASKEQA